MLVQIVETTHHFEYLTELIELIWQLNTTANGKMGANQVITNEELKQNTVKLN